MLNLFALVRRARPRAGAAIAIAAMALALAAPAHAEKADRTKSIEWSADAADVNGQTKGGTVTGNVIISQGTLTIRADKVVFHQNPDSSLSATAYGNPVTFRQKRDGVDEYYEGFAQRGEYDGSTQVLQLFDRALLRRGADEIRSNYIWYNMGTEMFKAEGRPSTTPGAEAQGPGNRVRGVFQPKQEPAKGEGGGKAEPGKAAPGKSTTAPVPLKGAADLGRSKP